MDADISISVGLDPHSRFGSRASSRAAGAARILCTLLLASACAAPRPGGDPRLPGTRFDHVVILAPDAALQEWLELHLTHADALETRHMGQGTRGRYFLFLDAFLEVLSLEDAAEARANQAAFGSDYVARWDDAASPIAIGLTLDAAAFASPPFEHVRYLEHEDGGGYVMAAGNIDPRTPLIYATGPARAYPRRGSIDEVESIEDPERRAAVRRYLVHPIDVRRLTAVIVRMPGGESEGPNAKLLAGLPQVRLEPWFQHEVVLEFDDAPLGVELRYEGQPSVVLRR